MHSFDDYDEVWREVRPLIKTKLEQVRVGLAERIHHQLGETHEGGKAEESCLQFDVFLPGSYCVVEVEFALLDSLVADASINAADGFGICLSISSCVPLTLSEATNHRDAFTRDVTEIVRRIEAIDVAAVVQQVCDEVVAHENLWREIAESA